MGKDIVILSDFQSNQRSISTTSIAATRSDLALLLHCNNMREVTSSDLNISSLIMYI